MTLHLLHPQSRMQKGKHHLHVRLQQLWKQTQGSDFWAASVVMSLLFQSHRAQLWSYLDELKESLNPKPERKPQTETTFLPASFSAIHFNKSILGLKEWDNFISGFAADLWCLFYHSGNKSHLLYSRIGLFCFKDSGETGQRMRFCLYWQSRLKEKHPTGKCNPFSYPWLWKLMDLVWVSACDGRYTTLKESGDFPAVINTVPTAMGYWGLAAFINYQIEIKFDSNFIKFEALCKNMVYNPVWITLIHRLTSLYREIHTTVVWELSFYLHALLIWQKAVSQ